MHRGPAGNPQAPLHWSSPHVVPRSDILNPRECGTSKGNPRALRGEPTIRYTRTSMCAHFPCRNLSTLSRQDRKSTRLNSSHVKISYAVFCLKKITMILYQLCKR